MGGLSIWHWLIVLGVGLLLFGGRGKVSDLMGDVAKGIKSFKKGLADDEEETRAPVKSIDTEAAARTEADSKAERSLS